MSNSRAHTRARTGGMFLLALVACGCFFLLSCNRQVRADKPIDLKKEMRPLWSPSAGCYIRAWRVCGEFPIPLRADDEDDTPQLSAGFDNDFLQAHGGEAGIRPVAGTTHPRADGSRVAWTKYDSPGDDIGFTDAFKDHPGDNVVWYAFTTVQRDKIGKAVLSVESDESVKVWLNGKPMYQHFVPRETSYADLCEASLNAGENAVLVKVVQSSNSGRFAFRVLEVAQAEGLEMTGSGLSPAITAEDDTLVVTSDNRQCDLLPVTPPVTVTVTASGGRVVAEQTVRRYERAAFSTAAWPSGPYEVSCSMTGMNGQRVMAYLPWYHGDARKAAERLVATAPGAEDRTPAGMTHAMLAALVQDRLGTDIANAAAEDLPDRPHDLIRWHVARNRDACADPCCCSWRASFSGRS